MLGAICDVEQTSSHTNVDASGLISSAIFLKSLWSEFNESRLTGCTAVTAVGKLCGDPKIISVPIMLSVKCDAYNMD